MTGDASPVYLLGVDLYLRWQLDPVLIGTLFTLALCYGLAVGPLRQRLAPRIPFPRRQAAWFYGALVLMYLVEGSPLHDLAERYSLTAHMSQHLLLSYVVAPMMLYGLPTWVLRPLLLNRIMRPISKALTQPLVAFLLFSLTFSAWHVPAIYDGALQNSSQHHSEHVLFLLFSLLLWWPLMSPLEELPRPGYPTQLLYLFALPIAQIPVFGAITFADHVLYDTYEAAPYHLLSQAIYDQALGGVVMKVGGLIGFGIPFIVLFFRWYRSDYGPSRRPVARAATKGAERSL